MIDNHIPPPMFNLRILDDIIAYESDFNSNIFMDIILYKERDYTMTGKTKYMYFSETCQ